MKIYLILILKAITYTLKDQVELEKQCIPKITLTKFQRKKKFQMTGVTFIILTIQTILSQYLCLPDKEKNLETIWMDL